MNTTMLHSGSVKPCALANEKSFLGRTLQASVLQARPARGPAVVPTALFTRNKKKDYYDKTAVEADPLQPAFTRRREAFVGRLASALVGFASALLGELVTGQGPLGQLQLELGLPPIGADFIIFGAIAYSLIGGLNPSSPTFSPENQRDVKKRQKGPTQDSRINLASSPKKTLGITSFGFSKQNEVFVGRTAQLGFLAAVLGEKFTGKGILGQVGIETGIPIGQQSVFLLAFIGFFLFAAVLEGNYGDPKDDSVY